MELSLAFLAEYADVSIEKRLHAFTIDFDAVLCAAFPATIRMVAIAKFVGDATDIGHHECGILVARPDGAVIGDVSRVPFDLEERPGPGRPNSIIMAKIEFQVDLEGTFEFILSLDGVEAKRLPLSVSLGGDPGQATR